MRDEVPFSHPTLGSVIHRVRERKRSLRDIGPGSATPDKGRHSSDPTTAETCTQIAKEH